MEMAFGVIQNNMKKLFLFFVSLFLLLPATVSAAQDSYASVERIGEDAITVKQDGSADFISIPQDITINGLDDFAIGDRVIISEISEGNYIISGMVRHNRVWILIAAFVATLFLLYKKKGTRLLLNLILIILAIIFIVAPLTLRGWPPVLVTTLAGTIAISLSLFISHGLSKKSFATIAGVLASLLAVGIISWIAVKMTLLTGFANEDASLLANIGYEAINMRSVLLAAMIIGALGVLDDIVIAQVSAVQELLKANKKMTKKELFDSAMRIGRDHTGAVVNTLALAYTGAAFPLVMLLYLREEPFVSLQQTFNNEIVATELVRLLSGTIGVMLAMPIATWIAVWLYTTLKD